MTLYPFLEKYKPSIAHKYLLFVAAGVWTFAGGMLLSRGFSFIHLATHLFFVKIAGSLLAGVVFYLVLFSKISLKHINRIQQLPYERPCAFSFFDWKSYILMSIMISSGVLLRLSDIVPLPYLSEFYITMGTPLFLSAFRFYISGVKYFRSR